MWAQKEGKASSKYQAVIKGSCSDNRARGMFQYKGASRTDRSSGRLIQMQNLKRPIFGASKLSIENVVNTIKLKSVSMMNLLYDRSVSDILGGSIRHAICAKPDHVFAICDLTSIESVILGWVSSCSTIDQTFRSGRDSYRVFASAYFKIPYESVTKAQRSFSKPPVLGCGFMLGWRGLVKYSEGYGVSMSEDEAQNAVNTFRNMYPEIPTFWSWIDRAVKHTTITFQTIKGYGLTVARCSRFLRISLPSGRALSYFEPEIREIDAPWSTDSAPKVIKNFTYMGMDDHHKWVRISAHSGGLTENIVQSIAGDILWHGIQKISEKGFNVALHVHDEIAIEVPESEGEQALEALKQCMTNQPNWCKNMWLGADGFLTKRYTKD
jgi:DNA polymerase